MLALIANTISAADYITDAGAIVKKADWKTMQTITVTMDEFAYEPDGLKLNAGQPYKIVIKNKGKVKHYFTAPEFFKAIATRKIQSNKDGEIKAPYFTAIELMVDGQLDLYFVPVKKGSYPVFCTVDGHRDQGMEGMLTIK
ncbi:hypothetical protein CXF93_11925 [Moritella sp. Urea-trap-13]|nr:hypothetical protein CXF93_11925 [Moritella sp. Urea-trap-13]